MNKSEDTVLFICKKDFLWNWDGFQIVQKYFENVHLITWDGNTNDLPQIDVTIKSLTYDYLISFWSAYYIQPVHFTAARKGAINVHPAPIEHPGLGMFSYIFAFPEKRMHHGTTIHEVNDKYDNGRVYRSSRFPCYGMSPEEIAKCSVIESLQLLEEVALKLKDGGSTSTLGNADAKLNWDSHFFTHKQEIGWLQKLPAYHIAHRAESYTVTLDISNKYFSHNCNSFKDYFEKNQNS